MDEYLCLVVTNDIANAVNRGAVIEYFGDNYQMAAHDAYYLDTDLSTGEQAIHILNSRIENALSGESKKFVEKNLVTMLTLLQARIQNRNQTLKFDIRPYVEKALEYIAVYRTRPQNIVSGKLLFYFRSVEDDLKAFLESDEFDIGPMIYSQVSGPEAGEAVTVDRTEYRRPGKYFRTYIQCMAFGDDLPAGRK